MRLTPARKVALTALKRARTSDAWIREFIDELMLPGISESDRAFARRLALGVTATVGTLDEVVDRHLARPGDVKPRVRDALRLAAYEMLFEHGDAHAAVSQGVEAAKAAAPSSAGMANAVLRRVSEDRATFPFGDPTSDVPALARLTGHPVWMTRLLVEQLGWELARAVLEANNTAPPLYLAHNPFRGSFDALIAELDAAGADPRVCEGLPGCVECLKPAAGVRSAAVASGKALVADAAVQVICRLAAPRPDGFMLDVGAGRGTKTSLLRIAAQGPVRILGIDVHPYKVKVLLERMNALGIPDVSAAVADATDSRSLAAAAGSSADLVFVDAPCSNLGTLRRHPERRWELRPDDIERLANFGSRLLRAAAALVTPGGFVLYSTCTISFQENEHVVAAFLESEEGASFVTRPVEDLPALFGDSCVTGEGWFRSLPKTGGPDGHFAAVLERRT